MAIYHCHCQVISRGQGRSAVAAAAYRSGEKITNSYDGVTHDYRKKKGIVYKEIMLCENAPEEWKDRALFWNNIEQAERDTAARLAREFEIALPIELSTKEQIDFVRAFVHENFVNIGMCADFAIHDKGDGNPHCHILLTMRPIDRNGKWESKMEKVYLCKNREGVERGFTAKELKEQEADEWEKQLPYFKNGKVSARPVYLTKWEAEHDLRYKEYVRVKGKNNPKKSKYDRQNPTITLWNSSEFMNLIRSKLADAINAELMAKSLDVRVDHRSYKDQGIFEIPTQHMGVAATNMERRGVASMRGEENRKFEIINEHLHKINKEIKEKEAERERFKGNQKEKGTYEHGHGASTQTENWIGRKVYLAATKEIVTALRVVRIEGIKTPNQFRESADDLEKKCDSISDLIDSLEQKIGHYREAEEYLRDYQKYETVAQAYQKQNPLFKRGFKTKYQSELSKLYQAKQWLEQMKIKTDIPPEKVEELIKEKEREVGQLKNELAEAQERIRALRAAEKVIARLQERDRGRARGRTETTFREGEHYHEKI